MDSQGNSAAGSAIEQQEMPKEQPISSLVSLAEFKNMYDPRRCAFFLDYVQFICTREQGVQDKNMEEDFLRAWLDRMGSYPAQGVQSAISEEEAKDHMKASKNLMQAITRVCLLNVGITKNVAQQWNFPVDDKARTEQLYSAMRDTTATHDDMDSAPWNAFHQISDDELWALCKKIMIELRQVHDGHLEEDIVDRLSFEDRWNQLIAFMRQCKGSISQMTKRSMFEEAIRAPERYHKRYRDNVKINRAKKSQNKKVTKKEDPEEEEEEGVELTRPLKRMRTRASTRKEAEDAASHTPPPTTEIAGPTRPKRTAQARQTLAPRSIKDGNSESDHGIAPPTGFYNMNVAPGPSNYAIRLAGGLGERVDGAGGSGQAAGLEFHNPIQQAYANLSDFQLPVAGSFHGGESLRPNPSTSAFLNPRVPAIPNHQPSVAGGSTQLFVPRHAVPISQPFYNPDGSVAAGQAYDGSLVGSVGDPSRNFFEPPTGNSLPPMWDSQPMTTRDMQAERVAAQTPRGDDGIDQWDEYGNTGLGDFGFGPGNSY